MGRKPVVALVGLVWAGMALVGCENCKNCRERFKASPTFATKSADADTKQVPPMESPAHQAKVENSGTKPEAASKQPEAPISGFGTTTPGAGASPTPIGTSASSANFQRTSMRSEDPTPRLSNPPGRNDELANSSETTSSRVPLDNAMQIPTAPVRSQTAIQRRIPMTPPPADLPPMAGQQDLPPIGGGSASSNNALTPSASAPPLSGDIPGKLAVPMSPPPGINSLPLTP